MSKKIKVACLGLGRIGSQFAIGLAKHIDSGDKDIEIVAIAEQDPNSVVAKAFAEDGIPVYTDAVDIAALGENVDIIFDMTGIPLVRQGLREALVATNNQHSVIVPEVFARLLWSFVEDDVELSGPVRTGY